MTTLTHNHPESVSSASSTVRNLVIGVGMLVALGLFGWGVILLHTKLPALYASAHVGLKAPK